MTMKNFRPGEEAPKRKGRYGVLTMPEFYPFGKGWAVVNDHLKEIKPASSNRNLDKHSRISAIAERHNYADKIKNFTPDNWPPEAPPYASAEGWEYEKAAKLKQLRGLAVISWYSRQGTARHSLIANRLREILCQ